MVYILKFWLLAAFLIEIGCVLGKVDSSCGICNRGQNIAKAAGAIYKKLPTQWPGRQTWSTRCKDEKHIIKNVAEDKKHLAVISYMAQYFKVLEGIYDDTHTKANILYQSCSANTGIRTTMAQMYNEHLNWSDIMPTGYNITLDVTDVEPTDARSMLKVIESFGNCLKNIEEESKAGTCAGRVFRRCGRARRGRKKKGGKKNKRQSKRRKGRRRSKSKRSD